MIHSYSSENFYSIGDKIEVDFTVSDNAPIKATYAKSANGVRVSLIESIIGPNASGKTNVLKTLAFMKWLLFSAYTDDPDRELPFRPFGPNTADKHTFLSVTFSIEERLFIYDIELIRERILIEEFSERSKTNELPLKSYFPESGTLRRRNILSRIRYSVYRRINCVRIPQSLLLRTEIIIL
jgi:hypothetical protein